MYEGESPVAKNQEQVVFGYVDIFPSSTVKAKALMQTKLAATFACVQVA